jgi:hypothetical protein
MKFPKIIIAFLLFSYNTYSQNKFVKVNYKVNPQTFKELRIENNKDYKTNDCLEFTCLKNSNLTFCNNKTDENYVHYEMLGEIIELNLTVILHVFYNEEFYIFINKDKCKVVTLIGFPLRIEDSNTYLVYNNPNTDKPYEIQIITINNGNIEIKDEIILPRQIVPERVLRVEEDKIFIYDINKNIWKLDI